MIALDYFPKKGQSNSSFDSAKISDVLKDLQVFFNISYQEISLKIIYEDKKVSLYIAQLQKN